MYGAGCSAGNEGNYLGVTVSSSISAVERKLRPRPHQKSQLLAAADQQFLASLQLEQQLFGQGRPVSVPKQLRNQSSLPRDLQLRIDHVLLRQRQVLEKLRPRQLLALVHPQMVRRHAMEGRACRD